MKISDENKQKIKDINIISYLLANGYEPVKTSGKRAYFHSPFRPDSSPSFVVNLDTNTFKDFGENEPPEDIIRLVQRLHNLCFCTAIQHLNNFENIVPTTPFVFSGENPITIVKEVKNLSNPQLIYYAEQRAIPFAVASQYLKEIHYEIGGRTYFSLGLPTDNGGYAIRNKIFKGAIKPNGISTIAVDGSDVANVFEGFFDFLSAVVLYGTPTQTTIVLNSTSNLSKAIPFLKKHKMSRLYLDHDPPAQKAIDDLQANGIQVVNKSYIYHGYKDLNDFLTKKTQKNATQQPRN